MNILKKTSQIDQSINFLEGRVILVNKDLDWTSFDVVNKIRFRLKNFHNVKKIKVGHNGTLDPKASGLLMIFTGKYTKLIPHEENHDKTYDAIVKLGATTESLDVETEEYDFKEFKHLANEEIIEAAHSFLGEQDQLIPIYSASKIGGKAMYKLAREGKQFEAKSKKVVFHEIEVTKIELPFVHVRIKCGKGTYIRAFARDLASKLNTSAYLYGLNRTQIADYLIEDAWDVNTLCAKLEEIEYKS